MNEPPDHHPPESPSSQMPANLPANLPAKRSLRTNLIFYTATLLTVLGLFQLTTAYGEANLEAPPNLNGRYLTDAAAPGCPPDSRLALTIQQSGRYLNAALELVNPNQQATAPSPKALSLQGHWRQQIQLTGAAPALATCQQPTDLALQAMFQPASSPTNSLTPAHLTGQIQLNGQNWPFTAQQQAVAAPTHSSH
jgi:hypothetical protein